MKRLMLLAILMLLPCLLVAAPLTKQDIPGWCLNNLILKYAPTATPDAIAAFNTQHGIYHEWNFTRHLNQTLVFFNPAVDPAQVDRAIRANDAETFKTLVTPCSDYLLRLMDDYRASGLVEWIQPNYILYASYLPNDPMCLDTDPTVYTTPNEYGAFLLHLPEAWDITTGNPQVVVGVLDSGCKLNHPDLADAIWVNEDEIPDNGIDDDGDGYIDDIHGWDLAGGAIGDLMEMLFPSDAVVAEEDANPDIHYLGDDGWGVPDPSPGDGVALPIYPMGDVGVAHGTHTAGTIAAVSDNGVGIAGNAGGRRGNPGCKIMPIRCMSSEGSGFQSDIVQSIEVAVDLHANVISMSLGTSSLLGPATPPPGMEAAINLAIDANIPVVAASGNDGSSSASYPAAFPQVLCVGSFSSTMAKSTFSSYGDWMDVCAPGGDQRIAGSDTTMELVWSTYVFSLYDSITNHVPVAGPTYQPEMGTSMACPQAAGIVALMLSLEPTLTPDEVANILCASATDLGEPGWDTLTGCGAINAYLALFSIRPPVAILRTPTNGTITSCPNQSIEIAILATGDIEPGTIQISINGETVTTHDSRLTWNATDRVITFTPATNWTDGDSVHVRLDAAGTLIPAPITWAFLTDFTAPTFGTTTPRDADTVRTNIPQINVNVSEDPSGLVLSRVVLNGVEFTLPHEGISIEGTRAVIRLSQAGLTLPAGAENTVTIGVQDNAQYCPPNLREISWHFYTEPSGVETAPLPNASNLRVTPNPTAGGFVVTYSLPRSVHHGTLFIRDLSGRLAATVDLPGGIGLHRELLTPGKDLPALTSGVYFLEMTGTPGTVRLVVE